MELNDFSLDALNENVAVSDNSERPLSFLEKYDNFTDVVHNYFSDMSQAKYAQLTGDNDIRFSQVLPLNKVRRTSVAIIGCGGLGNWIWRVLLGMGFANMAVFDDDVVDTVNIGPQAHNLIDLELPKVEAVRRHALEFRGVNIRAFNQRVYTFNEIHDKLGFTPDIVIGVTDSADFRNGMIRNLETTSRYPNLWLDIRMGLGDWICYAVTKNMIEDCPFLSSRQAFERYRKEAVFSEEEALREPCTARAITYTGANVASYVGALIHWFLTDGREIVNDGDSSFYSDETNKNSKFVWRYSYSSRDFAQISGDRQKRELVSTKFTFKHLLSQIENRVRSRFDSGILGFSEASMVGFSYDVERDRLVYIYEKLEDIGDGRTKKRIMGVFDGVYGLGVAEYTGRHVCKLDCMTIALNTVFNVCVCDLVRGEEGKYYLVRAWSNDKFEIYAYDGVLRRGVVHLYNKRAIDLYEFFEVCRDTGLTGVESCYFNTVEDAESLRMRGCVECSGAYIPGHQASKMLSELGDDEVVVIQGEAYRFFGTGPESAAILKFERIEDSDTLILFHDVEVKWDDEENCYVL